MKNKHIHFLQLVILLCIFCTNIRAQSYVEKMLTHKVTVHYPDHMINAHVKPTGKVKVYNDRSYYWFSGNQISMTQGGYSGKLLNGEYEDLYLNKNLKTSGVFDRGLKAHIWRSWAINGRLKDWYTFDKGKKNGSYNIYDTAGRVIEKGGYRNDLLNGKQEKISGDSMIVTNYQAGMVKAKKTFIPKFLNHLLPKKKVKSGKSK